MKVSNLNLLPEEHGCNWCGLTKPIAQMIVVHIRRTKVYYLRPRCKHCHNERERGHRREWKRKYLQSWRARNAQLDESYWKGNAEVRQQKRINAARHVEKHHYAILIQGRFRRRGMKVSLKEAQELLVRFGRCYPTRFGLTAKGLRECERIRSRLRNGNGALRLSPFEIRIMVYEDGLFIKPSLQPRPYQFAAERLREWHRTQRLSRVEEAA